MKTKLEKIIEKYNKIGYNGDNFNVGGGLSESKFASNRHEEAKNDKGKLTLGEATAMFSKAVNLTTAEIKELITFYYKLEWHHAGKLPKSYGGGMKKTYFINSEQIVEFAGNIEKIKKELIAAKKRDVEAEIEKKKAKERKMEYLQNYARLVQRIPDKDFDSLVNGKEEKQKKFPIVILREMNGKFGWFPSQYKYNLPEYVTAWIFEEKDKYLYYIKIYENISI